MIDSPSDLCILIVDDEQNIIQSLQRLFRTEPYTVFSATSGQAALDVIPGLKNLALIISDQRMPEMNGSEFLRRSREVSPDTIRMLLTGHADMKDTIAAINDGGATRYIAKPWHDDELVQTVRDSIDKYRLQLENRQQQEIIKVQNEELQNWNSSLKDRVLVQTTQIRNQLERLKLMSLRQHEIYYGVIAALAGLIELRSPISQLHAANTAALSVGMATRMGLGDEEIEIIKTAAHLHDIGKNAMSDVAFVSDEADMSDEDRRHYREHPVLAQTAIDMIEELRPAGILIRHHHECFNGSGFPDGLKGDAIPRGAAIIALADGCDRAMTGHLGVRAVDLAIESLGRQVGTHFDPHLFSFLKTEAHELYDSRYADSSATFTELEVLPSELRTDMVLTQDLYTPTGLFLMRSGTEMDSGSIGTLQRIYDIDPLLGKIKVGIPKVGSKH